MSTYDRTKGMFMDIEDVMLQTGKGKTFASYALHSIAEVCGYCYFGVRDPTIASSDFIWWIKTMGGLKMDWKRKCLQDMETAQRLWAGMEVPSEAQKTETRWIKSSNPDD